MSSDTPSLALQYNPQAIEEKIYAHWEDADAFASTPRDAKKGLLYLVAAAERNRFINTWAMPSNM